uniref:Netrin receptor UNC5 n=1 Tax=Branchiostoma floridae TaxID=7739 RepID=C3Y3E3_BRAFL|eukprot:XP_002609200.1 hypothetical protein BRAFLDRAFT_90653 [Branchiostoma floridae]
MYIILSVYRTEWKPCTAASQTECGDCLEGFFTFMGTCVHETAWEASTFVWRSESSMEEVLTTRAYHTATVVPSTPEVAIAPITTPHLPIFIGISASAVVLFSLLGLTLTTFRLRRRKARPSSREPDCEGPGRTDDDIHGDGCGGRVSLTDELSSDIISTLRRQGTELSTDSGCDVASSDQDSSDVDSRNPSLTESLSPIEIVQSPQFNTMEGDVNVYANPAEVGMFKHNKLWVDVANATLGVSGGCLGLPALDTYLFIDSVERDTDIELAVLKNPKYLPALAKGESLVSPIISCSPHGVSFQNPALLSFPHCGDVTSSDVTLLVSDTSLDEAPKWREASLDGNCGVSYMVKGGECLVYTSHFTLFGLKAKSKQVKIMIFSKLDRFFEVHVFCVNDTPESLNEIEAQEREHGFHLKCPPKEIRFVSNDKDVKVKMSLNATDGWEIITQHKKMIGYTAVQQNSNPYVAFHLRAVSQDTSCASVHVVASQKSSSSVAEFDFLLSLTSSEEKYTPYHPCPHGCSAIEQFLSSEQSPTPESFLYYLSIPRSTFQPKAISQDLQEKLISRLDVKVDTGNDFRSFADELGFDSFQRTLLDQRFDSPTHCLLMYMELRAQKMRQSSSEMLQELAQILKKIERSDLATLIETHLQQRPLSIASNSTDSGLGPGSPNGSQLSVATSASGETIGLASPLDKPHLETTGLLEGDPQNLSPTVHVVHPARTENQDNRSKVETEV